MHEPNESVRVIGPQGREMIGVLALPPAGQAVQPLGVIVVVGGPQTRVGSHRQFVLLARALARAGYACLRFDYTGMGDSPGPKPDFEHAGPDIRRACDALVHTVPSCERIALWGLCDGASAAMLYAPSDDRISVVIAANPWARSDTTRSAAIVSQHYGSRLRSGEFWRRVATGKVTILSSIGEAIGHALRARGAVSADGRRADLPTRLARVLSTSPVPVRFQLSGRDLSAAEFEIAMKRAGAFGSLEDRSLRVEQADHTFSDAAEWQNAIADTLAQLRLH